MLKEVKPSADSKMIRLVTFDNLFRNYDILTKIRSRMAITITFSRQNDASSCVRTT